MKKQVALGVTAALLTLPISAMAHGSKTETVGVALAAVLAKFEKEEKPEVTRVFAGMKGWTSGTEIRVKVYLEDKPELLYACRTIEETSTPDPASRGHGVHCEKK